jgi:hypothetical protein
MIKVLHETKLSDLVKMYPNTKITVLACRTKPRIFTAEELAILKAIVESTAK